MPTDYFYGVAMTDKAALARSVRSRLPVVGLVIACVAGVVAAVTGAANPVSAVQFLLPGHWIYNSALQAAFHVDGATGDVDAQARVPGGPGDQVFQGDTSGYVVGDSRITEFGRSSLSVEESTTPPAREQPVGVETAGGPYLVYRAAGKVVRLGAHHTVLSLGGPVGIPVATRDGTLWLPRTKAGHLCQLAKDANQVSCPVPLPKGHAGALSTVSDRLVFVDTTRDTVQVVEPDGLGEPRDLGIDAHDDASLASTDVGGRLAILDGRRMHLVDAGLGTAGIDRAAPVTIDLGAGEYAGPVSTGDVVAVVNRTTNTLTTYDRAGKPKQTKEIPAEQGDPRLTRGEDDRIYVDGAEGEHVVVVDTDGELTDVPIEDGTGTDKAPVGSHDPDARITPKPGDTPEPGTTIPPRTERPEQPEQPQQHGPEKQDEPPAVPPSPPGAPTGVNATAGNATATVTWGPAPDNRSAVTGYRITWPGGQTTVSAAARTSVVDGLANGTTYVFTVAAVNGVGTGPGAAANPVTPAAPARPAGAATGLQVLLNGNRALFDWDAPADMGTGTFTHYVATMSGAPDVTVTGPAAGFDIDPSTTATLTFTVRTVTTTPEGQQLVGPVATTTKAVSGGTVTLSRGPATQEWCAGHDSCAWMHVVLNNMRPNTTYHLQPFSNDPSYSNTGGDYRTDANGHLVEDQFAYYGVGHNVWIVVTDPDGVDTRSNDLVWEAG
jgi:fibronectin type III domain protein